MFRFFAILLLILSSGFLLKAQELPAVTLPSVDKPLLFTSLSENFQLGNLNVDVIFNKLPGDTVLLYLNGWPGIAAIITDKVKRPNEAVSLNMQLLNFKGALFSITKSYDASKNVFYQGVIIHPDYGDVYLVHSKSGKIELEKKQVNKIMLE